jgi:hypothetical protein
MHENEARNLIQKMLVKQGALVFTIHGHGFQQASWPDIQVYHWRWSGHIEMKNTGTEIELGQSIIMEELRKRGTCAFVLRYMNKGHYRLEGPRGVGICEIEGLENGDELLGVLEVTAIDAGSGG